MKKNSNKHSTTALAVKLSLTLFATSSSLQAAVAYTLNNSLTDLLNGIAVWDTVDGALTGTATLTSTAAPNILTVEENASEWTLDLAVAHSWTWVYVATSSSGGGAADHEVEKATWNVDNSNGGQFYFEGVDSAFVSGTGFYGSDSGRTGEALQFGFSGSGASHSFRSGAGGTEWELTGNGSGGASFSAGGSGNGGGSGIGTVSMDVTLVAVPEPSSASLLMLGTFALVLRRKR